MVRAHAGKLSTRSGNHNSTGNLRGRGHYLRDIIVTATCAAICGAENWGEVECFGKAKQPWLRKLLRLPNGIPSQEAIGNVFELLDTQQLREDFGYWLMGVGEVSRQCSETFSEDVLRRKHQKDLALGSIDVVSIWNTNNGLALGQNVVHGKSNADTAIPELLSRMELSSCIVTLDTVGCQRSIPQQIMNQGADYALAIKASQGRLHQNIRDSFSSAKRTDWNDLDAEYAETVERSSTGVEKRRCWSIFQESELARIQARRDWPGLRCVAMVQAERGLGERSDGECRYYISSLPGDAFQLVRAVRDQWEIGNDVHWLLDISRLDGGKRRRRENGERNMALLHDLTLDMINAEGSPGAAEIKRKRAGWDDEFLRRVLSR